MIHLGALTLALALLAPAPAAEGQQAARVPRIGYLSWAPPTLDRELADAFIQGLRERGYTEGRNVAIEYRRGTTHQLPGLAAELVDLKVDAIVTIGTPAALAAKQSTPTIPIVITLVSDPVGSGLATSLARPGGNVTGLSMFSPEVYAKGLSLLKDADPRISRVAVLMDRTNPGHVAAQSHFDAASNVLSVTVQRIDVRTVGDLDAAFGAARRERADAFYVFPLQLGPPDYQRIVEFAVKNRLPTLMDRRDRVEAGGLMSYSVNFADEVRRTAVYVDKILKGAKPADLPLEQPTKFELVINLKTAKALGLTIPPSVLLRADQVIDQ
jgi:ABC-type uncharacterized transport system substrate-binding protein